MENQPGTDLFNPVSLKGLEISNRIVMAPMTRSRALGSLPNDLMARYYSQRASSGLIISEGTAPSPNGTGYARIPGIYKEEQMEGWRKVTEAVHRKGGRIFLQLMHTGRIAHPHNLPEGAEVLAPSAIGAEGDMWTDAGGMQAMPVPREMTVAEVEAAIEEYTGAALNAVGSGFDGVEIHAANGYLPGQFLNPHSNRREDGYGGNVNARSRFLLEIAAAVSKAVGKERMGVRLSPYSTFNSMPAYKETFDTYDHLSKELDRLDIVYIHLVEPAASSHAEGRHLIETIRKNFRNALILNGGYTKERALEALRAGRADLISFGSPFISNPDLPERLKDDLPLSPASAATFYSAGEEGYTDYPFARAAVEG